MASLSNLQYVCVLSLSFMKDNLNDPFCQAEPTVTGLLDNTH